MMQSHWDGKDRRAAKREECCTDFESRVSTLEANSRTQERDIDRLLAALGVTNGKLETATVEMVKIRTTQRNTHVFAGLAGATLGGLFDALAHKLGMG